MESYHPFENAHCIFYLKITHFMWKLAPEILNTVNSKNFFFIGVCWQTSVLVINIHCSFLIFCLGVYRVNEEVGSSACFDNLSLLFMFLLKTKDNMRFWVQVFSPSHHRTKAVWYCSRDGPAGAHTFLLSRDEQFYKNGSWYWGLSTYWIWIQQIKVSDLG